MMQSILNFQLSKYLIDQFQQFDTVQIYREFFFYYIKKMTKSILSLFCILFAIQSFTIKQTPSYDLSMYYCGFGKDFCGDSKINDVNDISDIIILAFASSANNGSIIFDDKNYQPTLVSAWKKKGKTVLISTNGQNNSWAYIFSSQTHTDNFVQSVSQLLQKYNFDGIDLNIQSYEFGASKVVNMIISLRKALGTKIIGMTGKAVSVYQGAPVPNPDFGGVSENYFVYIIKMADQYIDYYQAKAFDCWFDAEKQGSLDYLQDLYLNWRNLQGFNRFYKPIPGFLGVKGNKLMIGLQGSKDAGWPQYYVEGNVLRAFKNYLSSSQSDLKGFMVWNSHWDSQNNNTISNICKE